MRIAFTLSIIGLLVVQAFCSHANEGKLVATAGLIQVEGAGGGGLVPWAILSGYDTDEEISFSANIARVSTADYRLVSASVSASFYDSVEISAAKQHFTLRTLGGSISQNIIGLKYKVTSDALYGCDSSAHACSTLDNYLPQISVGILHKRLSDTSIANALGARSTQGNDLYVAASKIHLAAIGGYNAVWNLSLRATKANEMGLLGFSSDLHDNYKLMKEMSAGVLLSRHLVIGAEYRQKPDNLGLGESDWLDYFISYIPNKSFSVTAAWTDLGKIAGAPNQQGLYLAISGHLL